MPSKYRKEKHSYDEGIEREEDGLKYVLENCRLTDYNTSMRQLIRHMPSKYRKESHSK